MPAYGTGSNVRDWLYVEDHAKALVTVLSRGRVGETYNVGGRNERGNIDVVHAIRDTLDALGPEAASQRQLITFVVDRPGHDHQYAIDASKLGGELGWQDERRFDTRPKKTVQWYLDNRAWWEPIRLHGRRTHRPRDGPSRNIKIRGRNGRRSPSRSRTPRSER